MYSLLEPYGFKVVGQLIALTALYGLLGMPLIQLYKFFSVPGRFGTVKPVRVGISAVVLFCLVSIVLLVPIPHHVYCSFYVQPANAANIFVDVPGTLEQIYTEPNQQVVEGQPILILASRKLKAQLASMQTQLDLAETHKHNVMQAMSFDQNAAKRFEEAKVAVKSAAANIYKRRKDVESLVVRAPVDGFFLAPPKIEQKKTDSGELGRWNGSPLDDKNIGAYLDQQTLVGQIVPDMTKMEAVLAIDQADIEFINENQDVEMLIHQLPGETHHSATAGVSQSKMKQVPKSLSSRFGGDIVATVDPDGNDVPQSTKYLVKVPLNNPKRIMVPGSTGVAKIRTGSQTVGRRIWRLVSRTFQFEL